MIIHGITFAAPGPQLYIRISTKGDRKRIDSGQAMSFLNIYMRKFNCDARSAHAKGLGA